MKLIPTKYLAAAAGLAFSASALDAQATPTKDIVETAVAAGSFKTLIAAVQAAGLAETLKGKGPFTVFAPTDEAFAKLPAGTVEALLKDKEKLTAILTYHVVAGDVRAAQAMKLNTAKTVNGKSLSITVKGRQRHDRQRQGREGGHRRVQRRDPRDRHGCPAEVTAIAGCVGAGGVGWWGRLSPHGDSGAAIASPRCPHLVSLIEEPESRPMLALNRPSRAAIAALSLLAFAACSDDDDPVAAEQSGTIVEVAANAGTFTTLVAAVQAAGLVNTLNGPGPFTVFAPTDDAFAKLPAGTVEALLQDPETLASILTYHVVPGKVTAAEVLNLTSATTVNGGSLSIQVVGNTVRVGGATVITTAVEASNGVIHVIDTVLLPPN
jgi:uncharacterized surface protein with fasciclin (FAS1) repeats